MEDPNYEKMVAEKIAEQERKLMAKAGTKKKPMPMFKTEVKIMIFYYFLLLFEKYRKPSSREIFIRKNKVGKQARRNEAKLTLLC